MKRKQIIALCMATCMLFTTLVGCGSSDSGSAETAAEATPEVAEDGREIIGNTYVEGLPIVKDPVTFNIFNAHSASDKTTSQNEKDIMKLSTEDTNLSFTWTETSEAAQLDSISLMLATGDGLPDAFFTTATTAQQIAENPEDFWGIDEETLKLWAPNIYEQFEANVEGGVDNLKQDDGLIYSFPTYVWSEYANWSTAVTYIRKDWLEAVGKEVPTTIDEMYDVLVAFKDEDPNGNGVADEIPFLFCQEYWCAKIQQMAGIWGMAGCNLLNEQWFGRVEDGKYSLNINDERFRAFLEEMNKWAEAGLINVDGFSLTVPEYTSLKNEGVQGVMGEWTPSVTEWEEGKWVQLPVLTAEGYEDLAVKAGKSNMITANRNTFAITTACENPEALLRWWDSLHADPELKRIGSDGPEGMAWEYGEDGVAYVKSVDPLPDGCVNDTEVHNTYGWRPLSPVMFLGESPIPSKDTVTENGIRYQCTEYYEEHFPKEHIPTTAIPAEPAADFSFTKSEIETAVQNYMASAIMNGVTDENWNEYVATIEQLGAEEWVKYYQCYVDNNWDAWNE